MLGWTCISTIGPQAPEGYACSSPQEAGGWRLSFELQASNRPSAILSAKDQQHSYDMLFSRDLSRLMHGQVLSKGGGGLACTQAIHVAKAQHRPTTMLQR